MCRLTPTLRTNVPALKALTVIKAGAGLAVAATTGTRSRALLPVPAEGGVNGDAAPEQHSSTIEEMRRSADLMQRGTQSLVTSLMPTLDRSRNWGDCPYQSSIVLEPAVAKFRAARVGTLTWRLVRSTLHLCADSDRLLPRASD